MKLLGQYRWDEPRLDEAKHRAKYAGAWHSITLVQHLYTRLYAARNDFLHGNALGRGTLRLFLYGRIRRPELTAYAPIVYGTDLYSYLSRVVKPEPADPSAEWNWRHDQKACADCLLRPVRPAITEE